LEDTIALWYDPARIFRFTREEIAWIIREAWGGWPPKQSGYIDTHEDVQCSPSLSMPGQAAIEVLAEVEARLRSTRESGEALIGELQSPAFECVDLWQYWHFRVYLSQPARDALGYASGEKRRMTSFSRWKWIKKARPWSK